MPSNRSARPGRDLPRELHRVAGAATGELHGQVSLVITSPPCGSSTHGHVRTPGPRRGKVRKINHKYCGVNNLAYRSHSVLADGFTEYSPAAGRAVLRPGGHAVVTARPYRRHGELIDIPGMVAAAGLNAGLELVEECIALVCGVRDSVIIPRTSFFQQKNTRDAIATGDRHVNAGRLLHRSTRSANTSPPSAYGRMRHC
ncbi:hypothetical protein Sar04_32990 [Salinispora arenicola]|uniref:Uncharacterized protein n=1 Tax=Salinispora arenicola TaxID=168697 RepID=A0ABQ4JWS2_SALAC|nr:hypothetical protein Sar04_32990 [Salinispora arenicola]